MRRMRLAIGVVVLVGAAAAAWFVVRAPAPSRSVETVSAPPVVAAPERAVDPPPALPVAAPPAETTPDAAAIVAETATPENSATLLARARAGNVPAMLELGIALWPCRAPLLASRVKQLQAFESGGEAGVQVYGDDDPAETREEMVETLRETIALCESLPAEERDRGFAWIEAAAVAGDATARAMFFLQALAEFDDETAILANIDEVERRRDLARRFAREDMAACADGAFARQRAAFDLLGMSDPVERLAIIHAHGLMQQHDAGGSAEAAAAFAQEASAVDELAAIEGKRRGAALYAHCAQ